MPCPYFLARFSPFGRLIHQNPHPPHAGSPEYIERVRRFGDLPGQVLAGEMQLLVQAGAPLGAVGDIVNHPGMRHKAARATFSGVAPELAAEDRSVVDLGLRVGPSLWPSIILPRPFA